jgi:hypothetical protein
MPRLAGVESVNPGVELCKSFGMLVELGGGGGEASARIAKIVKIAEIAEIERQRTSAATLRTN